MKTPYRISPHKKCYHSTVYQLRIRGRGEGVKREGGLNNFHNSPDLGGLIKEGLIRGFTVYIDTINYSIFLSKLDL